MLLTMIEKKALAKGEAKGMEKGMKKGMEKGRYEAMFDMARNFLALGVEMDKIATATGLPMQELEKIRAEL